jgi:magnesium transporter
MLLDLKFSVGTLGLAMGTFLAGLYGMNLENFIEETNWGFGGVTAVSTMFSLLVCWYGLGKLRRVQRIKMESADRPLLPRRAMHGHHDGALGLMDPRSREIMRRMNMQKGEAKKRWWFWQ